VKHTNALYHSLEAGKKEDLQWAVKALDKWEGGKKGTEPISALLMDFTQHEQGGDLNPEKNDGWPQVQKKELRKKGGGEKLLVQKTNRRTRALPHGTLAWRHNMGRPGKISKGENY